MNASRRFYQLLDQGRAHADKLKVDPVILGREESIKAFKAFKGLMDTFGELHRLFPEVKHETRERIMKRATAMYCHALKVPCSEAMRRQLAQESVVAHNLDGSRYVDGVSPVCVIIDEPTGYHPDCVCLQVPCVCSRSPRA